MILKKVVLHAIQIEALKRFYAEQLGFALDKEDQEAFTVRIGESRLAFLHGSPGEHTVYHFAFTIPGALFRQAKEWFRSKVPLNKEDGEDDVSFEFMDAHSFYFDDPDGNVVECIARNRCPAEHDAFSIDDIVAISEINLTVRNVLSEGQKLIERGFQTLNGKPVSGKSLNFIGDFDGYFLLGPEKRVWFFSNRSASVSPVSVELDHGMTVGVNPDGAIYINQASV